MPIYEFDCRACAGRFEGLVPAGTESLECTECGSADTVRVMSSPGAAMKFVKSRGDARAQERRNAKLHTGTKASFKKTMGKIREAKGPPKPPPGAA